MVCGIKKSRELDGQRLGRVVKAIGQTGSERGRFAFCAVVARSVRTHALRVTKSISMPL